MFVGLEYVDYLVNCFVVSAYAKAFYVWVGYKWRICVTTCQFHGLSKMRNWGWDMLVAKRCSFGGFPCIRHVGSLRFV